MRSAVLDPGGTTMPPLARRVAALLLLALASITLLLVATPARAQGPVASATAACVADLYSESHGSSTSRRDEGDPVRTTPPVRGWRRPRSWTSLVDGASPEGSLIRMTGRKLDARPEIADTQCLSGRESRVHEMNATQSLPIVLPPGRRRTCAATTP